MIVTLDFICLRLDLDTGAPQVLLIKRPKAPHKGEYALVGGWIWEKPTKGSTTVDQTLEEACERILESKVGVQPSYLEQVSCEGSIDRDPSLGWSVTIPHLCLFNRLDREALEERQDARWVPVEQILAGDCALPFDHALLVQKAYEAFVNKARYSSLLLYLLPETFTIRQIVGAYRALGLEVTKQTIFSRWVNPGLLEDSGERKSGPQTGPTPTLYRLTELTLSYFGSAIGKFRS